MGEIVNFSARVLALSAASGMPARDIHYRLQRMPPELATDSAIPFSRVNRREGRPPQWYLALYVIANSPALRKCTARKVWRILELKTHRLAWQVVGFLSEHGLVAVVGCDLDKEYQYQVTQKGEYVLKNMVPYWGEPEALREKAQTLPPSDQMVPYIKALEKLTNGAAHFNDCFVSVDGRPMSYTSCFDKAEVLHRAGLAIKNRGFLTITDAGRKWLKENT